MGLFDFVKAAGARIFGGGDSEPEETQEQADARRANALRDAIAGHGIESDDLSVAVEGDRVTVSGTVSSQEEREKVVLICGNTAGVAQVDDQCTVEEPEPEATFYTVESGDTLSKIAKEHYGNAMKYPVIFEANRPMLEHPDRIYPGQVLRIPPLAEED